MNYLRWYRQILQLPVINEVQLKLIEPGEDGIYRLRIAGAGAPSGLLLARKIVLATGIQGGGEWHVPPMIAEHLPEHLYAHTSQKIDFAALRGKRVAILGGGASAFDNANFVLTEGAAEAHVFVRREQLPNVNPIRQMEVSGMIERFHALADADKYAVISHFFNYNQPPTNDTFARAAAWPGFRLHLDSPWLSVAASGEEAAVTTPKGEFSFDFLIVSTGLLSDPALRPELQQVQAHIAAGATAMRRRPERRMRCWMRIRTSARGLRCRAGMRQTASCCMEYSSSIIRPWPAAAYRHRRSPA